MSETTDKIHPRLSSPDAARYFRYMAEFVGFGQEDAEYIRQTQLVIEKYIPSIVEKFYTHLLRYPPTRAHFLNKEGKVDKEYLELRMYHQANFWRRTASGVYDDEYASFVDYVGRAHTSEGADPKIYIPERYVIGMVGFVQYAISEALETELVEIDPQLQSNAVQAWNKLMMVLLEMLSSAYDTERQKETYQPRIEIDEEAIREMAVESYERSLGMKLPIDHKDVLVARVDEIPDGERRIVQVDDRSIGVFHHQGEWVALSNSCLHRSGPVCAGKLSGDTLTCPWHGYQYDVTDGKMLIDPSAKLSIYPVEIRDDEVHLIVPIYLDDDYDSESGGTEKTIDER